MKKIDAFLLAACLLLSGCGQGTVERKQETTGQIAEQTAETETVTEPGGEKNLNARMPWDLKGEDPKAYDLSWEELKSFWKEREVEEASQETELPQELAEMLLDILTRQVYEGWFTVQDSSTDNLLESYRAKNCEAEEAAVRQFLGGSEECDFYDAHMREAYIADLDGDGRGEMIVLSYCGGTIGQSYVDIWRQKDDTGAFMEGHYVYYYTHTGLLSVGGQYHYVAELIDHYGESEGFLVFSFPEDGTVNLNKVTIGSQEKGKTWIKLYKNETLGSATLDRIQSYIENRKSEIESGELYRGEAEIPYTDSEDDFSVETFNLGGNLLGRSVVDFDNDGEMECYCISSASGQTTKIFIKKEGSHFRKLELAFPGYSFSGQMDCRPWSCLWFEEFDGKNYIFRLDRLNGTSDYFLLVQLIQDRKLYPVMNYLLLDNKVCKYEKADPEFYINFK